LRRDSEGISPGLGRPQGETNGFLSVAAWKGAIFAG
jgi:hypothetical protein